MSLFPALAQALARTVRSAIMRRMADPARRDAARVKAERARRKAGRPHEVWYFHQADDPYSQLAGQALAPFLARYDVQLRGRVVDRPTPIAIHEKKLWDAWALADARAIAPYYSLRAPAATDAVTAESANRALLKLEDAADFAQAAALPATDLARRDGLPAAEGRARVDANFALRHELGHYLGGMFYYEGEWYWGIDRLHYLEARLDALGARRSNSPKGPSVTLIRRAPATLAGPRQTLEFFCSLRSPYTHLAYARLADLRTRYPVDLVLRPVLPMMMRGVKADRRKGQYILFDTQREADSLGVPFGNIWDPFGDPVRRAYSLFAYAQSKGRAFEYFQAYSYAVWGERVNAAGEAGLKTILARAGIDWNEARPHLDNRDWEAVMEQNVQDMLSAGSWGVPTLRLPAADGAPAFTVWGQDRLWLLEEELARRAGKT